MYTKPKPDHISIKLAVIFYAFFVSISTFSFAQSSENTASVLLNNKKYLKVQACTNQIFRIRVSDNTEFPESLMERYGILKTDWENVTITSKKSKGKQLIQTANFQLSIDEKNGEISVSDSKGNAIINKIELFQNNASVGETLKQSLNDYFREYKKGGGIIGDEKFTGEQTNLDIEKAEKRNTVLSFSINDNERFYGGGATSRKNIQHRGEALRMWATYQKTEITMPFVMSSEGWGIFNNTTSLNYFDIGRFENDKMFVYNTYNDIDFYIMLGKSMDVLLEQYTTITRKPYLLPKWAYGLAFGGNTMENQMDVMNDAVRFRDEKIPCDIFWLEPQWMAKHYDFSTEKNWDLDKFPAEPFWEAKRTNKYQHPLLFISKLHKLGFKMALWLCIDHDLSVAEEDKIALQNGTAESGQEHWFPHLNRFIDQGVDGFKLDPGRTLDEHPDRKYYNGLTDKEMHNLNQVLLTKQMYETFREHKGIRSFHHYCGGYAGTQHWGASTSGDNGGGKDALFDQLNLGLSGFVNTSADVMEVGGGDASSATPPTQAAIHLGFFLPWVQVNSWYALHHPWYLAPVEKETFRFYAQLRNALNPYIYSAAIEGSQTGKPILRAMPLEFPDDRNVDNMIYQYMFGENLLVGVFSDSIYLPKGNWINYWTNENLSGGRVVHAEIPTNRGGLLFVKSGAIIPYQKPMQYIGEFPTDTLILKVFPEKESFYTLLEDDGQSFDYEQGQIASTKFNCIANRSELEFTIHKVQGTYNNKPKNRVYELEITLANKPKQVRVNDKIITDWNYENEILEIRVQKVFNEKLTIKIDNE